MLGQFQRVSLIGVVGLLLFGSITASAANNCERRIRNGEMQLQKAVARHGYNSRQAERSVAISSKFELPVISGE